MKAKIKLDIVSDVMCPWCIVGYKRLEKAIQELGIKDQIDIEWQPFELNPNMPKSGQDLQEHIMQKYGSSPEQVKQVQQQLSQYGSELGFNFDYFEGMRIVNSREAHILLDYARKSNQQTELKLALFTAFFSEQKDISKREVLREIINSIDLNTDEAMALLDKPEAKENIQNQEAKWQGMGVSSVPTVVFNNTSALTGVQPIYVYKRVLSELLNEQKEKS
ncbi:DsbA family oxidoreductase [Labilibacter marinus]|uniref:DsbA family oxidoreductase n=1 Tax=Labilibacter marinus TaxID=1477105 RepID=UPI00082C2D13|nr:DsbA family oxidoreductase [Labilibacter marinus]